MPNQTSPGLQPRADDQRRGIAHALLLSVAVVATWGCASTSPLHKHIRAGNTEMALQAISSGRSSKDLDGALLLATWERNPRVAKALIEHGANPNARNRASDFPLFWAAQRNSVEIAELLLRHGAGADTQTSRGFTALDMAAEVGSDAIVRALLDHGADPGRYPTNFHRLTALHLASRRNHLAAARALLERGASPDTVSIRSDTPLIHAAAAGHLEMMTLLVKHGAGVDYHVPNHDTALLVAIARGEHAAARHLIEKGANLETTGTARMTPLMQAAQVGNIELYEMFIRAGANVHAVNRFGDNAMSVALVHRQFEIAKRLIQRGSVFSRAVATSEDRLDLALFRKMWADFQQSQGNDSEAANAYRQAKAELEVLREEFYDESNRLERQAARKRMQKVILDVLFIALQSVATAGEDYLDYQDYRSMAQDIALQVSVGLGYRAYSANYRALMSGYTHHPVRPISYSHSGSPFSRSLLDRARALQDSSDELEDLAEICEDFLREISSNN